MQELTPQQLNQMKMVLSVVNGLVSQRIDRIDNEREAMHRIRQLLDQATDRVDGRMRQEAEHAADRNSMAGQLRRTEEENRQLRERMARFDEMEAENAQLRQESEVRPAIARPPNPKPRKSSPGSAGKES